MIDYYTHDCPIQIFRKTIKYAEVVFFLKKKSSENDQSSLTGHFQIFFHPPPPPPPLLTLNLKKIPVNQLIKNSGLIVCVINTHI